MDTAPDELSAAAALHEDLLVQAGLMLAFIDEANLGELWREYEAASPQRRIDICRSVRMRLAPEV